MSLSKYFRAFAAAAAILAQPALACSFDISFNSHFEPGADRLPASEVRRLAEWMIDDPARARKPGSPAEPSTISDGETMPFTRVQVRWAPVAALYLSAAPAPVVPTSPAR